MIISKLIQGGAVALALILPLTSASASEPVRLNPDEYRFPERAESTAGTSGTQGIQTAVLSGDPTRAGLYTILIRIPPNTRIDPHSHRDDRVATVISGDWSIGYGAVFDPRALRRLAPGGFYTEPPGLPHFARTGRRGAVVSITGFGPTDTQAASPTRSTEGDNR